MKKTIYLMHPIKLQKLNSIKQWYNNTIQKLEDNFNIFQPLLDVIRVDSDIESFINKENNISSNSAIVSRDLYYASNADILFVDFTGSDIASIGCCFELAIGYWEHKHIVAVIPKNNVHLHCFIQEVCSIIFTNYDDAIDYIKMLA